MAVKTRVVLALSRIVAVGFNGLLIVGALAAVVYLIYITSIGLTSAGF